MDRNPNDPSTSPTGNPGSSGTYGTGGMTGSTGSSGSTGGTATPPRSDDMSSSSSSGRAGGMQGSTEHAVDQARDTAREKLGDARSQAEDAAQKARGWKKSMEHGLADRLQAGASKLRDKAREMPSTTGDASTSGTPAYAGGAGGAAVADRAKSVEQNLARGMDATADWLRNGDLQSTVQEQARSNPARTLLIALGVGYLLGKSIKR